MTNTNKDKTLIVNRHTYFIFASILKHMKKILISGVVFLVLASCQYENTANDTSESEGTEKSAHSEENTTVSDDIYAQDWETFKQAVISKDKDAVLFFAAKNQEGLKDILDMSYDYIFDDIMIENIEDMNYSDLPKSAQNPKWKELSTYYYGEEDGEIDESGTFLYFEERPEGLRIVNFLAAG